MSLFFKEFFDVGSKMRCTSWIHPTGSMAALFEINQDSDSTVFHDCKNYFDSNSSIDKPFDETINDFKHIVIDKYPELSASVFKQDGDKIRWQIFGNMSLMQFNKSSGQPLKQSGACPYEMGTVFIAATSNIRTHEALKHYADITEAKTSFAFSQFGKKCQTDSGWNLLVFPFESKLSYINPAWPYNPYIGFQEDMDHEKLGLYKIADALFKEKDFSGFRIVGGNYFVTGYGTRLLDGILISPWGVFLLELKHHNGDICLETTNRNQGMVIRKHTGNQQTKIEHNIEERRETNPMFKIEEALRKSFKNFDLGVKLNNNLRKGAALVFTNPKARVACVGGDGTSTKIPSIVGNIVVATPETLANQLRKFTKDLVGVSSGFSNNPFAVKFGGVSTTSNAHISQREINLISEKLGRLQVRSTSGENAKRKLGRFLIDSQPNIEESTTFFNIYDGVVEGKGKRIWAKRFDLSTMGTGSDVEEEIGRILREISALQDLSHIEGVQRYWDKFIDGRNMYVVLDWVEGDTLDKWLMIKKPTKNEKYSVLLKIAETLHHLAEEKIVHRAIKPFNVRIDALNKPTIINFELCQMQTLETILPKARDLMDEAYQSRGALTPGSVVTPADDTYSFGKLCCLVLAGHLPFSSYSEQVVFARKPDAWDKFGAMCGLDMTQTANLRNMISNDRSQRPTGSELQKIVRGWI
ncbi:MAG: protein kinase [Syntrophaceae bacterium]|nr:protein kinase [Syntrophaceae bacterium]